MYQRLFGQETEYAIRYTSDNRAHKPGNAHIFRSLAEAIKTLVKTKPGERHFFQEQFFTENGGAFCYEHLPYEPQGGLIEGATPECSSPIELLTYQRAQEALLLKSLPVAQKILERQGYSGKIGLVKNCKDSLGNIYGAQESYTCRLSQSTFTFRLYQFGILSCIPMVLAMVLFYWTTLIITMLVMFALFFLFSSLVLPMASYVLIFYCRLRDRFLGKTDDSRIAVLSEKLTAYFHQKFDFEHLELLASKMEYRIFFPIWTITLLPFSYLLKRLAFKSQIDALTAFLVTRIVFTGAGTVDERENFAMSEKATAIKRVYRRSISPEDRPMFDFGNLHKGIMLGCMYLLLGRAQSLLELFSPKQRVQLGLSDSNRADHAEYLKIGVMSLMVDMADSGYLEAELTLSDPISALRAINADPSLSTKVETSLGPMTAIEIQKYYLNKAKKYYNTNRSVSIESHQILASWDEVISLLVSDPGQLIGRIDWVTKKYLLETAGEGLSINSRKKIDIAYHELGDGYYDSLLAEGIAPRLVDNDQVEKAIYCPSTPKSCQLRSNIIKSLAFEGERVHVSWSSARIGSFWARKLIFLHNSDDLGAPSKPPNPLV